jgi:hypothetical protein
VLDLRFFGALLYAKTGRVTEALAEWTGQLPDAIEVLGERHEQVRRIREQLDYWRARE